MVSWTTTRLRGFGRGDDSSDNIGMYDDRPDITPLDVVTHIPKFLDEVTYLRDRLRERLA